MMENLAAAMIATRVPFRTDQPVRFRGSDLTGTVKTYRLLPDGTYLFAVLSAFGELASNVPAAALEAVIPREALHA